MNRFLLLLVTAPPLVQEVRALDMEEVRRRLAPHAVPSEEGI